MIKAKKFIVVLSVAVPLLLILVVETPSAFMTISLDVLDGTILRLCCVGVREGE